MYWHIDTDIVSLIVIVALYVYSVKTTNRDENFLINKRFLQCILAGIFITVVDIAASVVMEAPVSRFVYHLLMTLYYIVIELTIVEWFAYSVAILYHDRPERIRTARHIYIIPFIVYAAAVVSNPWSGLFFKLGENNEYSRGPLFFLMVALYALYAAALVVLIIVKRKHIPEDYPGVVLLMVPLVLALAIPVQLLNPGWLMIMPAYMVCLILAFLFIQTKRNKDNRIRFEFLSEAALTDQLTGLLNRAGMEEHIQKALLDAPGVDCLVAIVDMDDLKHINDTLGHPEGDVAIRAVAKQLKNHFRATDAVARFGGDEFVVYLNGNFNEVQVNRSMRQLVEKLASINVGEGEESMPISSSVGASLGVVGCESFESLCDRADIALYHVKRSGKNGYAFYEPEMENNLLNEHYERRTLI